LRPVDRDNACAPSDRKEIERHGPPLPDCQLNCNWFAITS
jgi:hypothetical protein